MLSSSPPNHKKVTGPFHGVHSENWAVYTYYNKKARRTKVRTWTTMTIPTSS